MYRRSIRALSPSTMHYGLQLALITNSRGIIEEKRSEDKDLEQAILHDVEFQNDIKKGTSEIYWDLEPIGISVV